MITATNVWGNEVVLSSQDIDILRVNWYDALASVIRELSQVKFDNIMM